MAIARPSPAAPDPRRIALVSDIEDPREIGRRNTTAVVAHGDEDAAGPGLVDPGLDDHAAVARRVPDRVLEQVPQDPQHLGCGGLDLRRRTDHASDELDAFRLGDRSASRKRVGDQVGERHGAELQAQAAGVRAAELEQVVDERGKVVGFLADASVIAVGGLRVVDHSVLECLRHRPDPRERGAEIVGHPADELPA